MKHRVIATLSVVLGIVAVPTAASASPAPDPPPGISQHVDAVDAAISQLATAYRTAPTSAKRVIHNEIALLLHTGHASL